MRKLPRRYENFIDNVFIDISDTVSDAFHNTKHTPNMITAYSGICGLVAIRAVSAGNVKLFIVSMLLSYFFDCLDGFMARKYQQETALGDIFDHVKDAAVVLGTIAVVAAKYGVAVFNFKLIVIAVYLSSMHFGCQQRYYGGSHETLDKLKPLCRSPNDLRYTKWFGSGTMNVLLIAYVAYVMTSKRVK